MERLVSCCGILFLVVIYGIIVPLSPSFHAHGGQMIVPAGGIELMVRTQGPHLDGNHQCELCTRPTFPPLLCEGPVGPFVPSLTDAILLESICTAGLTLCDPRRDRSPPFPESRS